MVIANLGIEEVTVLYVIELTPLVVIAFRLGMKAFILVIWFMKT